MLREPKETAPTLFPQSNSLNQARTVAFLRQKAMLPLHGNLTFTVCFPKWMNNPPKKKPLKSVFHKLYSKRSGNKVYYRAKVSA